MRSGRRQTAGQDGDHAWRQYSNGLRPYTVRYTVGVARGPAGETLRTIGQLSTVGLSFVLALVMGFGAGHWLDGRAGTAPWGALVGFACGAAAGVLNVVRVMRAISTLPDAPDDEGSRPRGHDPRGK